MNSSGKIINETFVIVIAGIVIVLFFYLYLGNGNLQNSIVANKETSEQTIATDSKMLNILVWDEYITETAIDGFRDKYSLDVNVVYYDDEEVMLSKILSERGKHDICIASGMYVAKLISMKLLETINHANIPDLNNINKKFRNPVYDPGNTYSIPYMWGTTGLVINTDYIKEEDPDWNVLFNPDYSGRIAMINDVLECFSVALKYQGQSLNTTDIAQLRSASDILIAQKKLGVRYLNEIDIADGMLDGNIWAALTYSGHITSEIDGIDNLEYILPRQGYCIWVDNLCIPNDASNKLNAELFINYLLDPRVSAEIANTYSMANANAKAIQYTDNEIVNNHRIYPSPEVLELGESLSYQQVDAQTQRLYNVTWQSLYSD